MPRPEYRDPSKKTIYATVDPETKEILRDICYHLDKPMQEAIPFLVRYYQTKEKVKPRPSRKVSHPARN